MDRTRFSAKAARPIELAEMDIKITSAGETITVLLGGSLDLDSTAGLALELEKLLDRKPKQVQIDLSGIRHLSSTGVAILLKFYQAVAAADGDCCISKISAPALRVLDLIGVKDSFRFKL